MPCIRANFQVGPEELFRMSEQFVQKFQETVTDAQATWTGAVLGRNLADAWSAQAAFGARNALRWSDWSADPVPQEFGADADETAIAPAEEVAAEEAEPEAAAVGDDEPAASELAEAAAPGRDEADEATAADEAAAADDLKRIRGIGPTIEQKLHEQGVYQYSQIAAMTEEEIEALDATLEFRGRITRDEWVAQAQQLLASR